MHVVEYIELGFWAEPVDGGKEGLPPFLGTTLRGALGHLLKRTVCQVSHGDCDACVLQSACPYPAIFEGVAPPDRQIMRRYLRVPQPFVLLVPPPDEGWAEPGRLGWGVRLFGPARRYWPYLLHVFQIAGEQGIGRCRCRYRLERVTDGLGGPAIWSADSETMDGEPTSRSAAHAEPEVPERCTLRWRFRTPVRLSRGRGTAQGPLDGLDLVLAGRRRFAIMDHFYGSQDGGTEGPPGSRVEAESFTVHERKLRPWRLQRYSGRQRQRMSLGGQIGEIVIEGPWGHAGPWLSAIDAIHLGKATSFGFGRVEWELA